MKKIKRNYKSLLAFVFWLTFMSASNTAIASLFVKNATLQPGFPITINETERAWGSINFGYGFNSIDSVKINMFFWPDLWTPGEKIGIFFPGKFGSIGIVAESNYFNSPYNQYTLLMTNWQDQKDALIDGVTDFYIEMTSGSVGIQSVEFEITGTAVPIPGAVWLLGSGLVGLAAHRRKRK